MVDPRKLFQRNATIYMILENCAPRKLGAIIIYIYVVRWLSGFRALTGGERNAHAQYLARAFGRCFAMSRKPLSLKTKATKGVSKKRVRSKQVGVTGG